MAAWAVPVREERPRWRLPGAVTATSQHRFNHQRLFETCGDIPPAELEAARYGQNIGLAEAG